MTAIFIGIGRFAGRAGANRFAGVFCSAHKSNTFLFASLMQSHGRGIVIRKKLFGLNIYIARGNVAKFTIIENLVPF